mmetsp:Transcript_11166/g.30474  ORF Transcript_11166/g.30474 Transcript_11166/m.30474 type:complete len:424 (+) Transcript_11166:123-1394(+)
MQAPVRHGLLSSHKCNRQKCTAGGLAHRVPHRWRWMAGQKHLRFPAQQVPQERMAGITSAAASGTPLQQRNAPPATEGMPSREKLTVSWAGAGIFFFWQLGAMKYLAERYDLTKIPMAGASGGALAAVLAACGVKADDAIELAYKMSMEQNIWQRKTGLLGVWGAMIEKWLDQLLPDNAHELCRNRVTVVVTTLPDWSQVGISDFKDKEDLINACMASSHVPFFLDFKLTRQCRGRACVDGSFPDFFTGLNSEILRAGGRVIFDYFDDKMLKRNGRMDMLEVKSYDEIRQMYAVGYDYAARLHANGCFDNFDLAEVLLEGPGRNMQELLVPKQHEKESQAAAPEAPQALEELEQAVISGQGFSGPHLNVDLGQQQGPQVSPPLGQQQQHQNQHQPQHQQEERADGGLVLDLEYDALVKGEKQK